METARPPHGANTWSPQSWKTRPAAQAIRYDDAEALKHAVSQIAAYPPLVTSWEVEKLRSRLADAAAGRRFVVQGGDCAETLADCRPQTIVNKLKIMLQMSLVIVQGLRRPVVRIGRIAGQYAKPRSSPVETRAGVQLPAYFGDLVNEAEFTPEARRPKPERLVSAYQHAALTLNFVRGLIDGGFADLHHPEYWNIPFLQHVTLSGELRQSYQRMTEAIRDALDLMTSIGHDTIDELSRVEFFTSHEALSLDYESALTRTVPHHPGYYNLSTHLPWIGERTRALDGAHVEYMRGIRNPVGLKLGPAATAEEVVALARLLDPDEEPGRLVLIGRFGAGRVDDCLPRLIGALRAEGRTPVWLCDPMHGNTRSTASGIKTRRFEDIQAELEQTIAAHERLGSTLAGVHFEMVGEDVTECMGGTSGPTEADLELRYESPCDPRLNYQQAMELSFEIARLMGRPAPSRAGKGPASAADTPPPEAPPQPSLESGSSPRSSSTNL